MLEISYDFFEFCELCLCEVYLKGISDGWFKEIWHLKIYLALEDKNIKHQQYVKLDGSKYVW